MSRDPYVTKCLDSIKEDYVLLKPVPYYPGNAWYGVQKTVFSSFVLFRELQALSSEPEASSAQQKLSTLRSKVRIVKHAPSEQDHDRFSIQQHMYNDLLTQWRITKWIISPWDFNNSAQLPYLILPFTTGGTLDLYLEKQASKKERVPEGFMWHIVHSVLSAILEIRFGYPYHQRKPVAHNAITPRAIVIDPYPTSREYPCYPDIKLTDFESAEYLPVLDVGLSGPCFDPQMANDIWGIRKLLHDLAHEKHLARDPQTWKFSEGVRGGCCCELLTYPGGHFDLQDYSYMHIYMELGDSHAHWYEREKLVDLLQRIEWRRRAATLNAIPNPSVRLSNPRAWDIREEVLPDRELEEFLHRATSQEQPGQQTGLGISGT